MAALIFSRDKLAAYVCRVFQCNLEEGETRLQQLENLIQSYPIDALADLQRRHLATFPFSNVVLHYSQHHTISLDPDHLFNKIVERGLGGYCLENTGLFAIILRTLGYTLYTGGARVSKSISPGPANGNFHGFGHQILIVTVEDSKYMSQLDVGFGPYGPTCPLALKDGEHRTTIGQSEIRLTRGNITANTDSSQRLWLYQVRSDPDSEWAIAYCFYDIEFLREDYEVMNWWTSRKPTSFFTQDVICTRFLLNKTGNNIVGCLTLFKDIVKRNLNGTVEILRTLKSEQERVSALKELFDVQLEPMEARGIHGKSSEIKTA
ncbi:N-terminal acetyltransferase [Myotisia sp. PD_48]|nr:N-terminal acetyltransferase [Myotisia sp. PD_48]